MKNRPTAAVALTLLFVTLLMTSVVHAADKPARALLAQATSEAQKWQKDAALVYVSTDSANPDGTAPIWIYVFESPKTKKQIAIMVQAAGGVSSHDGSSTFHLPVGEFADSNKIMTEAKKNGLKPNKYGTKMSLGKKTNAEWTVQEGDSFYKFDAANGKFLRKEQL